MISSFSARFFSVFPSFAFFQFLPAICTRTAIVLSGRWQDLMTINLWVVAATPLFAAAQLWSQPLNLPAVGARGGARLPAAVLRADVDLVLISAIVTDRRGATVNGLLQDKFTVFEDKVPQPIVAFSTEETPCSVGVVLDLSASMRDRLPAAIGAVRAFLKTANHGDESFLLAVGTRPKNLLRLTADFDAIEKRLAGAQTEGNTALIDTVYLGLNQMRSARNGRRALLIVSDGMDNQSRYSAAELLRVVREADVQIHTIRIAAGSAGRKPIERAEEQNGLALLQDLAERTGGLSFSLSQADDMLQAAARISEAVRNQYVVGYRQGGNANSGKWRRLEVKVSLPHLRVYARRGYFAN
jgi:Ca-activated chloride channel family protein